MTLLTVADLKKFPAFVGTTVDDDVLTLLLAAAEQAIERELGGPVGTVTEVIDGGLLSFLTLRRRALSVTSITEVTDTITTTLAADDWRLALDHRSIFRLGDGTNPSARFPRKVTIVYEAEGDEEDRKRVQAELVDLDLNYVPGKTTEQIGAWLEASQSSSVWNYSTERAAILATLWPSDGIDFA